VRSVVLEFQAELPGFGQHDERARHKVGARDDSATVQHYTLEFEKRWKRYARPVGASWRMDETYVKVRSEWVYLYRAVDKAGKTVDFLLNRQRDINAAKAFVRQAIKGQRVPAKVTLDAYAARPRRCKAA
jgi:transposase-like protein